MTLRDDIHIYHTTGGHSYIMVVTKTDIVPLETTDLVSIRAALVKLGITSHVWNAEHGQSHFLTQSGEIQLWLKRQPVDELIATANILSPPPIDPNIVIE